MTGALEVFTSTGPASHDLAFEAEMMKNAAAGRCGVLAASWTGPVVVLGYAQSPEDVDLEWCRVHSIPVLRRLSGGTGVIHRGDLSVALALPADHTWAKGIVELYDRFLAVLSPSLIDVGSAVERLEEAPHATRVRSPICFEDRLADTLVVDGRKAVGCSQTRRKGAVLIHAAILLGLDPALYAGVFRVGADRVANALAPAVSGVDWMTVARSIVERLGQDLGLATAWSDRPDPEPESLAPYGLKRWAPVPDDGMRPPQAELV